MNWDDAPGALHAELFEESCGDNFVAAGEGIGIEQSAADYGDEDDAETAPKDLRGIADHRAACHGA